MGFLVAAFFSLLLVGVALVALYLVVRAGVRDGVRDAVRSDLLRDLDPRSDPRPAESP